MLDRLLASIYSALDKSPQRRGAFGISRDDGIQWHVSGRFLTVSTGQGEFVSDFDLRTLTIGELAGQLERQGCSLSFVDEELGGRLAATLLPGRLEAPGGNTLTVYAYDSLLWAILDSYAIELEAASLAVDEVAAALSLSTAEGDWLDFWGDYFGIVRGARQDAEYRAHIVAEVTAERSNPIAIESLIRQVTGRRVQIEEPWRQLFRLNESRTSDAHFYDGSTWGPHLIRPVCSEVNSINWTPVVGIVQKSRPAGVVMLSPEWRPPPRFVPVAVGDPLSMRSERRSVYAAYDDKITLSNYMFGTQPTQNYLFLRFNLVAKASLQGIAGVQTGLRVFTTQIKSQIRFSDPDSKFGDDDFRFPGYAEQEIEPIVFGEYRFSGGMLA